MKRRRCFATMGSACMFLFMLLMVFPSTGLCAAPEKTLTIGYIAAMTGFAAIGETPKENGAKVAAGLDQRQRRHNGQGGEIPHQSRHRGP